MCAQTHYMLEKGFLGPCTFEYLALTFTQRLHRGILLQVQPPVSVRPCFQVIPLSQNEEGQESVTLHFQNVFDLEYNTKCPILPRWTTLPSLRERNKCWTKFGILCPTSDAPMKTYFVPIPPRLTEKTKVTLESPPGAHFSQLSQSAPSLDLLDASFLLQVQTNIHNSKCWGSIRNDPCN